jgi:uncharacterized membrane protein YjjP (DUF1212 family)
MELFTSKKSKEFWGLVAAAGVCYGLSLLFKAGDLQNILVVVSAVLFIIAIYRLKRNW